MSKVHLNCNTVVNADDITITNTTRGDLNVILWLFEQAIKLQGKSGYKV